MKIGAFLFLFSLLCGFEAFSASKTKPLFSAKEKEKLERLKSDEALIQRYQDSLQLSGKSRLRGFLESMSRQEKLALMGEWRDPEQYWRQVDQAMTQYYFQKWLRREWYNLEEKEQFDFLPKD